jgi:hypothetical protein|tara:strand:- start:2065 stop:2274 length:210 start_codon:yes stop_codon:yes gene_type:complete
MAIKNTVMIKETPFNIVLQELSDKYNQDLSDLSFAALKNIVNNNEWGAIERAMNPCTFATREFLKKKVH